ncbi:sensor domain-containing diguanylate cyclase [Bacillus suaedaesalsae]|uniref:Sensor domain-containing diguanylate cyclase n=1 Tax=Bacillus suaedaesalsae TaxID=2810349 RepID=A0ABS2DMN1_9BACI|nr:sensor domain-containing diguanylate cyclase [Bacillus suaedaesalsae]MBM6619764.1 sensor domain-containing diguanylate cyclase [Bacillus suaedaesalsae]
MNQYTKRLIWITWLVVFPFSTWLLYLAYPPSIVGYELDLLLFLILMCIMATLPIIVNDTPIFFTDGVSLAVFLAFGLFIEMVLMQLAIFVLILTLRITKESSFRIPMNSLMFMAISVIGALVYYLLGGTHGFINIQSMDTFVPVLGYIVSTFLANSVLFYFTRKVILKSDIRFFSKDLLWEVMTYLLVMPVGVIFYILYSEIGVRSIFYVGLPIVALALILKLYSKSQNVNSYLQKVGEIGHQLSERIQVNEVLTQFLNKITSLFQVDYAYIIDVNHRKEFEVIRYNENGEEKEADAKSFQMAEPFLQHVYNEKNSLLYKRSKEWLPFGKEIFPHEVESVIAAPIIRHQQTVGMVVLASQQKRAYERFQLMIVDILVNYLAVAIENARHYEQTRKNSEHCALTGLYNYRYFETRLQSEFDKDVNLSLILLDIDHFKKVNDTYGHQAGNQILSELATRLLDNVGELGTVARYGGEEYAILLPNMDRDRAYQLAESIRISLYKTPFVIQNHLSESEQELNIQITASIGVAAAPQDADDPISLIRNADRALYTGAKQKGRNKVAIYMK